MSASNKPRKAKQRALAVAGMLMALFAMGTVTVWKNNPTIEPLGYVALVAMLILLRAFNVSRRRAAGTKGERPGGSEASNRVLRTVGILVVLAGLALAAVGLLGHFWGVLGFMGLAVAGIGILFVRISFDRPPSPGTASGEEALPKAVRRFDRLALAAGIALVPINVFSFAYLRLDASHGWHQAWPLDTFVAVLLVSIVVWPYLLGRAYVRWLRG